MLAAFWASYRVISSGADIAYLLRLQELRGAAGAALLLLTLDKHLIRGAVSVLGTLWGCFAAKTALFLFLTLGYPALFCALQNAGRKTAAR